MSDHPDLDHPAAPDQRTAHLYACIRTGGDEYVIYDRQNPTAWIQSDTSYPIAERT